MCKILMPILFFCSFSLSAQTKIAILPFSNLDGEYSLNKWCYELQDSLIKAFQAFDPEQKYVTVVPAEEVENALSDLNIDANSPTFDSDKWKVAPSLKAERIISGTFRVAANRFLINSYIYYPETQLSDPDFQARDIFKKEEKILESVSVIVRQLSKAFVPK